MMLALAGWLLLVPVAIPALVFATELLVGLPASRTRREPASTPRFAVLMPAHDEAATIAGVVAPLLATMPSDGRLLVVADNCTDDTAAIARALGAEVIERHDPAHRGKGFALAWGRDRLAADPPGAVVVLDADCLVEGGGTGAAHIAAEAVRMGRAVQARYVFAGDLSAPAMVQVSNFALLVKNRLRQRGLGRLGVPVPLGGTGMAFPWATFATAPLATDDLVEDLALGLHLAERGEGARYLDAVRVTSAASTAGGTLVQRTRWEHGFLSTARTHGLRLLGRALRSGRPALGWAALHLMTPPLALLVMLLGGVNLCEWTLVLAGMAPAAAVAALALLGLVGALVLVAWAREGRDTLAPATLLRMPLYLAWKLPVYLKLARGRETRWVRSERTGDAPLH